MKKKLSAIATLVFLLIDPAYSKLFTPPEVVEIENDFLESLTDSQRTYLEEKLDKTSDLQQKASDESWEFYDLDKLEDKVQFASLQTTDPELF